MDASPLEIDVADFARRGFAQLERITSPSETAWLASVFDRLFLERTGEHEGRFFDLAGPLGHDGPDVLPQILEPERIFPALEETACFGTARHLAAQLLEVPEEEVHHFGHMILKPAARGRETAWHQDEAYWDGAFEYRAVSIWIPLDDASVESGCMQFIPGSHRGPVRLHQHIDDDPLVHGLTTDDLVPDEAVACPIRAGGATIHHCRTLHFAGANRTDQPRRALIHVFSAPPIARPIPYERPWLAGHNHVSP